ncbi:proline dehydrogenase [Paenibacillus macerans]|nr:proline dehydrogenase [Paenibacillus macerans]
MDALMRTVFLALAQNRSVSKLARRYGLRFGASRFVAGETLEQAIETVRRLNGSGREATLDHLGEFVSNEAEASRSTEMCLRTLDAIAASGVRANLSLKLTSLGLGISEELCMRNMTDILERARMHGLFVRIDMEDYAHCEKTIAIYRRLRREFDHVGIVIQAYLYRSVQDLADLKELKPNLRLVKGAYKEPPEVAYPNKPDVDENFKRLISTHLKNGNYTAIATHDPQIIGFTKQLVKQLNIPLNQFEFQMLYGIREELQLQLAREGYKVRIYVPFGRDWFGYFMRRLAERPANVWFVLKNLFK